MKKFKIDNRKLAQFTGVSFSTIARLRNSAGANSTTTVLLPIAKFFNVTLGQLIGEEDLLEEAPCQIVNKPKFNKILMIHWNNILDYKNLNDYFVEHWIATEQSISKNSFATRIVDDDLGLILRKGVVIIVNIKKKYFLGDYLLINDNGIIIICKTISKNNQFFFRQLNSKLTLENGADVIGAIIEIRYTTQYI